MDQFLFWVSMGAGAVNICLIFANLRQAKLYNRMIGEVHKHELELRWREAKFNAELREAKSGLMPDTREYLEEVAH